MKPYYAQTCLYIGNTQFIMFIFDANFLFGSNLFKANNWKKYITLKLNMTFLMQELSKRER